MRAQPAREASTAISMYSNLMDQVILFAQKDLDHQVGPDHSHGLRFSGHTLNRAATEMQSVAKQTKSVATRG